MTTVPTLTAGAVFNGRYEIVRLIAAGGMGAVYEAMQLQTKRRRALKVMLPQVITNDELRERFKLEATVVAAVESEHIAQVLDAGVDDETGSPFIVMELLKGEELGAMVERVGALEPAQAITFLSHAAFGLAKTHAESIVHRDLKPENLFVTYRDDGSAHVKILDFGIAKVMGDAKTQHTKGILGSPLYISPEQVHGQNKITPRTDVYALAHIAYTLLVGEPYWTPEQNAAESIMPFLVGVMGGHKQKASVRVKERCNRDLPAGFDAWFDRATARDPNDRYEGTRELVAALAKVYGVEVGSVRTSVAPPKAEPATGDSATTGATGTAVLGGTDPSVAANLVAKAATASAAPRAFDGASSSATSAVSHTFNEGGGQQTPKSSGRIVVAAVVVGAIAAIGVFAWMSSGGSKGTMGVAAAAQPTATSTSQVQAAPPPTVSVTPATSASADLAASPSAEPSSVASAELPPSTDDAARAPTAQATAQNPGAKPNPAKSANAQAKHPPENKDKGWRPPVVDR